jgi:LppX_LprAFG lipoprotein
VVPRPAPARVLLAVLPLLLALTACSSGGGKNDPAASLAAARKTVDATPTMHVVLTSPDFTVSGVRVASLEGSLARPDRFGGNLQILLAGSPITVPIYSAGGNTYARLPLTTSFTKVDPSTYGIGDPAGLLNPDTGLSSLLTAAQHPTVKTRDRINGEVVDEITASLPGSSLARILPGRTTTADVPATLAVTSSSHQLRRVVLTGALAGSATSTVTIVLDHYGEAVTIASPTGQ